MGWRSEVAEGWRLFLPAAREVVTPRRRRVLVAEAVVLGVGVAAVVHALTGDFGEAGRILVSVASGVGAAAIAAWISMAVWRPKLSESEKWTVRKGVTPEVWREIRRAHDEGREPAATDWQRHLAADNAQRYRSSYSRVLLTLFPGAAVFVGMLIGAIGLLIATHGRTLGAFGGVFGAMVAFGNVPAFLRYLGQTTAIIAERPEGDPVPPPAPKPYRPLGTDHPTDYDR